MLSTPFSSRIIKYEPPRGFIVPKFSTYDGSSDPFDHIMHYRHKQNISTLQNLKMQENETLREFVKRFGQAVLQVKLYSMDAVLQIFKRSICLGTPFFESLAKKPPTTMDDLFQRASPRATAAPVRAVINYIYGGPLDDEYSSKRKRQRLLRAAMVREHMSSIRPGLANGSIHPIDGTIVFPTLDPARALQPHRDALILTIGVGDYDVKRISVDPSSSADLLQVAVIKRMGFKPSNLENPRRTLSGFNGSSTTSLGDVILSDLSPSNAILGCTWLHGMKVIPSTYHQRVSFITQDGQIDLYGSQLTARQCYQIACEAEPSADREHSPKEANASDQ
uniref:Retrotransposon gag domain-containing protein n=1 Tax=Vitis vinifera TaxID=29760 RepID=A5AKJ8_VITVI|nr:hypothetical protein VITISV_008350 [Vitis vinifera]